MTVQKVSKELKESTRTLCRQLQDNPDVEANTKKIKGDRDHLVEMLRRLLDESRELTYTKFRNEIASGIEGHGLFDKLRNEEKELNLEIKRLNDDFKKA